MLPVRSNMARCLAHPVRERQHRDGISHFHREGLHTRLGASRQGIAKLRRIPVSSISHDEGGRQIFPQQRIDFVECELPFWCERELIGNAGRAPPVLILRPGLLSTLLRGPSSAARRNPGEHPAQTRSHDKPFQDQSDGESQVDEHPWHPLHVHHSAVSQQCEGRAQELDVCQEYLTETVICLAERAPHGDGTYDCGSERSAGQGAPFRPGNRISCRAGVHREQCVPAFSRSPPHRWNNGVAGFNFDTPRMMFAEVPWSDCALPRA